MSLSTSFFPLLLAAFFLHSARANSEALVDCLKHQINPDLEHYESYKILGAQPRAQLADFQPQTGVFLKRNEAGAILRNADGTPVEARMRVLTDNPGDKLFAVGDFNHWGEGLTPEQMAKYELKPVPGTRYHEGVVPGLKHGDRYRFVLNGHQVIDPSSIAYTTPEFNQKFYGKSEDFLNSVFWDFDRPDGFKPVHMPPDLRRVHGSIGEVELHGVVEKFPRADGGGVGPKSAVDTYAFIADPKTGFVKTFKDEFGYNAIHVLPVNQSIEGLQWQHRYQVYGNFAIDTKFGSPEEFQKAVDALNGEGVGVIFDYLGSHFPYKKELADPGLTHWYKETGQHLYATNPTEWGTLRYDYQNPYVRRFLIDGALDMFKRYGFAGIRIDNVGGLLEQPGGRQFLTEMTAEIRKYKPDAFIMSEDFFGNDRTQALVHGGLGANGRNGNIYFDWVRSNAQRTSDQLDMHDLRNRIRSYQGEKEMGQINYITNHDESAQGIGGATGAYFPSLVDGGGDFHSYGKARAFNSLGQLTLAYSEDTPQLRLLQRGNLNDNPAVEWGRLNDPNVKNVSKFSARLTQYLNGEPAFAFENLHGNIENHTDYNNKIISFLRTDPKTGKKVYALVNLSPNEFHDYRFGVDVSEPLKVKLDSDASEFGGSNRTENAATNGFLNVSDQGMHEKSHSVSVPYVAPYSVMIFER